jgi:predicted DNA-binding mobile mystery protein A
MDLKYQKLMLKQVDEQLTSLVRKPIQIPPRGWINTIREALTMSTGQLARRLGVTQPAVVQWEAGEREETISLATLRKAAAGMECNLVYAFVPRKSLSEIMQDQARVRATSMVEDVAHSMELESQKTSASHIQESIREEINLLLEESPGKIWDDWSK